MYSVIDALVNQPDIKTGIASIADHLKTISTASTTRSTGLLPHGFTTYESATLLRRRRLRSAYVSESSAAPGARWRHRTLGVRARPLPDNAADDDSPPRPNPPSSSSKRRRPFDTGESPIGKIVTIDGTPPQSSASSVARRIYRTEARIFPAPLSGTVLS
jgi:hypothetical protein